MTCHIDYSEQLDHHGRGDQNKYAKAFDMLMDAGRKVL